MITFFRSSAFLAVILYSCGAGSETNAGPAVPVYPLWNLAQLPDGPDTPASRLPMPGASAVLVAPGYLLASTETMGEGVMRLELDPAVYIFDGKDWHAGRYVDYDRRYKLALIRADVPGTPIAIAPSNAKDLMKLVAIPWAKGTDRPVIREETALAPCDQMPDLLIDFIGERFSVPTFCYQGRVRTLSGGALIDGQGRLGGLQVSAIGAAAHAGIGAAEIRDFVTTYFASWGRDVRNKPTHLYQL